MNQLRLALENSGISGGGQTVELSEEKRSFSSAEAVKFAQVSIVISPLTHHGLFDQGPQRKSRSPKQPRESVLPVPAP